MLLSYLYQSTTQGSPVKGTFEKIFLGRKYKDTLENKRKAEYVLMLTVCILPTVSKVLCRYAQKTVANQDVKKQRAMFLLSCTPVSV